MKILFVCTGNTCRSPMAEGLFRRMVRDAGLEDRIECGSAGLAPAEGAPPAENAVAACLEAGVDISGHRARRFDPEDLLLWDVFFTMSSTHGYILKQAGVLSDSIYLPGEIPDPYGQDLNAYRRCRDRLAKALQTFYNDVIVPALGREKERP